MLKWTAVLAAACGCTAVMAQSSPDPGQQSPVYTLGTSTRLVLEDVLVTDRHGAPVRNLPASAFHLVDNGVEQKIIGFESAGEARTAAVPQAAKPGVFSNAAMVHPGGQVVVLLVDNVSMEVADQMYLRIQMLRYLKSMPAGIEVAVFKANGGRRPLLMQSLTTDRGLIQNAIERAVPGLPLPTSTEFSDALSEVANISAYLEQVPGRKQLVWFAGRFPLYESPLASNGVSDEGAAQDQLKLAYRLLERARVEVYPIDVRGVMLGGVWTEPAGAARFREPGVLRRGGRLDLGICDPGRERAERGVLQRDGHARGKYRGPCVLQHQCSDGSDRVGGVAGQRDLHAELPPFAVPERWKLAPRGSEGRRRISVELQEGV